MFDNISKVSYPKYRCSLSRGYLKHQCSLSLGYPINRCRYKILKN